MHFLEEHAFFEANVGGEGAAQQVEFLGEVGFGGEGQLFESISESLVFRQHLSDEPLELVAVAFGEGEEYFFLPGEMRFKEFGVTFEGISPLLAGGSRHIFVGRHIVFEHLCEDQKLVMLAGERH